MWGISSFAHRLGNRVAITFVAVLMAVAGFGLPAKAQDSVVVPGDIAVENCPIGFQYSRGIIVNVSTQEVFTQCNSELNAADLLLRQQDQDFWQAQRDAQAAAEAESRAWNEAHPGQQRCVQWGPIVHANGVSTASGGVCANPVAGPAVPSSDVRTESATIEVRLEAATIDQRVEIATVEVRSSTNVVRDPAPTQSVTPITEVSPAPAPAATPHGVGGWAIIDSAGNNLGTTVCDVSVCGDPDGEFVRTYNRDHPGTRFVYFAPASSDGNVAGWNSGTYDAATNLFSYNGCTHPGGASLSDITCPPPPTSTPAAPSESVRTDSSQSTAGSSTGSDSPSASTGDSSTPVPPVTSDPNVFTPQPAESSTGDVRVTTDVRIDQVQPISSDIRVAESIVIVGQDGATSSTGEVAATVAIASLVKSAGKLPTSVSVSTVKIAVANVKITTKSLTPKICKSTSKGVVQKAVGLCRLELSVRLQDGSKVSTVKTIRFKKRV